MRALLPEPVADPEVHAWYARNWVERGGIRMNFVTSVDGAVSAEGPVRGPADARRQPRCSRRCAISPTSSSSGSGRRWPRATAAVPSASPETGRRARAARRPSPRNRQPQRLRARRGARPSSPPGPRRGRSCAPRLPRTWPKRWPASRTWIVAGDDEVDYGRVRSELAARGLTRVLCEGGPTVFAQLAAADGVDELCLSVSPLLAGPGAGPDHRRDAVGPAYPAADAGRAARGGRRAVPALPCRA